MPADFTTFSSLAIVAQGGSTGATRSCSQGPSEEPVSRPGSKIEYADLLGRSTTSLDVSVQICPCSGFGIWAFVSKSTQNILICQKIVVSGGASYMWTSAMRFRTDIEVHSLSDDPLLPRFFRHCCWWTTAVKVIFNALSTSFEKLNPRFDTPVGKIIFPRCSQQVFMDNPCDTSVTPRIESLLAADRRCVLQK